MYCKIKPALIMIAPEKKAEEPHLLRSCSDFMKLSAILMIEADFGGLVSSFVVCYGTYNIIAW